jgi:hypothetical protein
MSRTGRWWSSLLPSVLALLPLLLLPSSSLVRSSSLRLLLLLLLRSSSSLLLPSASRGATAFRVAGVVHWLLRTRLSIRFVPPSGGSDQGFLGGTLVNTNKEREDERRETLRTAQGNEGDRLVVLVLVVVRGRRPSQEGIVGIRHLWVDGAAGAKPSDGRRARPTPDIVNSRLLMYL